MSAVSTGGGLLGELCPDGSIMSGRQDGLAEQCPQSVHTVNPGLVSMNYIFHERNLIYLHGEDKVRS